MLEVRMAQTAKRIMEDVLEVKPGEKLCIVTDTECPDTITRTLAVASEIAGAETTIVTMARSTGRNSVEPSPIVAAAIQASDVMINQSSYALTHSNAQRDAVAQGVRVCNIRGLNEDMMIYGGVTADYKEVRRLTQIAKDLIDTGKRAHITTPEGTDLWLDIEGRTAATLDGFATEPGTFSGLPDGEAACAPMEGKANGVIVNPYFLEDIGVIKEPLKLVVENGLVVEAIGGLEADKVNALLNQYGDDGRNIAEFAIPTNEACRLIGKSREDKKKLGTVHVAMGDSKSLGGTVVSGMHVDIMMTNPTLKIDDQLIIEDGKILFG